MFGNVWDQRVTLEKTLRLLSGRGRIVISHPMGAAFQRELSIEDPELVPHTLPDSQQIKLLIEGLPLNIHQFSNEALLYICVLKVN